jgi:hypothetical protein
MPSTTSYNSLTKIGQLQLENIQKHNSSIAKNRTKFSQIQLEKEHLEYTVSKLTIEL